MAKVFVFATVMDLGYQYLVFGWMYPLAALSIAFLLAFVPYLLIRGPVNRIARMTSTKTGKHDVGYRLAE